jgi:Fur family iron response transcriptional regulator
VKAWADKNFPKLSLATVYNTLGSLVEGKLLREFRFPHSERVIYDSNVSDHYHFIDEKTGELFDVEPEEVTVQSRLGKGFQIDAVEVLLRGRRVR